MLVAKLSCTSPAEATSAEQRSRKLSHSLLFPNHSCLFWCSINEPPFWLCRDQDYHAILQKKRVKKIFILKTATNSLISYVWLLVVSEWGQGRKCRVCKNLQVEAIYTSFMFRMKNHCGEKCKQWEKGWFKLLGEQSPLLVEPYSRAMEGAETKRWREEAERLFLLILTH